MKTVIGLVSKRGVDVKNCLIEAVHCLKDERERRCELYDGSQLLRGKVSELSRACVGAKNRSTGCLAVCSTGNVSHPLVAVSPEMGVGFAGALYGKGELAPHLSESDVSSLSSPELVLRLIEGSGTDGLYASLKRVHSRLDGGYVLIVQKDEQLFLARDQIGRVPLFIGENREIVCASSIKRMFWRLGVQECKPVTPGCIYRITPSDVTAECSCTLQPTAIRRLSMEEAAEQLKRSLYISVGKVLKDIKEAGVAFSGGLDSSLVAWTASKLGGQVRLYTAGLEGSRDVEVAPESAQTMGLPIRLESLTLQSIERLLPKVVYTVETDDPLDVSTALPLYVAAEMAAEDGVEVLLSGQGSDELFAGYHRYLKILEEGGYDALQSALWLDLMETHSKNLARDFNATSVHGIELRLPFLDPQFVRSAMELAPSLKISLGHPIRKFVLRKTAEIMGIPSSISGQPKKAVQYSSGVNRAIKRLAQERGEEARTYLNRILRETLEENGVKDTC